MYCSVVFTLKYTVGSASYHFFLSQIIIISLIFYINKCIFTGATILCFLFVKKKSINIKDGI